MTSTSPLHSKQNLISRSYPNYRILGACNPALAKTGLEAEQDLGVFLPCNIVVYETENGEVVVSAVDPKTMLSVVENEALDEIAEEVDTAFGRVLDSIAD
ncbi:MAG: DUF302 domain-containing protein [Natrialbaceae archaeon]|nr:DUF302 domain-containing protein [Natrialbaceae archaeon]